MNTIFTKANSREPRVIEFSKAITCFFVFLLFLGLGNAKAQFQKRVYANTQTNNIEAKGSVQLLGSVNVTLAQVLQQLGINLADLGTVTTPAQAVDVDPVNGPKTFSTLSATYLEANLNVIVPIAKVKVGALVSQSLQFPTTQNGTKPVTVKLGVGGGLAQTLIDGLSIQATLNGNLVGTAINKNNGLAGLLGNKSVVELTFTPGVAYDGVKISLSSENALAALNAFQSVNVYHAYYLQDANALDNCDGPFDLLYGTKALVTALGGVANPWNAIDNNETTAATLSSGANVVSTPTDGVFFTSIFPTYSQVGDSVRAVISYPGTLLELQLLSSIAFQTISHNENGTENVLQTFSGSSLLHLELLTGSSGKAIVTFKTNQPFNRLRIWYGGVAVALQSVNIFEVSRMATSPVVLTPGLDPTTNTVTACGGSGITLTIQNPESGSTYNWYTTQTGGSPITTGVSANGTIFTPTNLVDGANDFYVSVSRAGCANEASARTKVTIISRPTPKATDIDVAGNAGAVCIGSPVVLTPSVVASPSTAIPNPLFRWYRNADKTGEILTGTSDGAVSYTITNGILSITGSSTTTTYYVSVTGNNGADCENAAGDLKAVTVTVNPTAVDATININSNITQCAGSPFVINPVALEVTNPIFAYYLDAAKTQPITDGSVDGGITFNVTAAGQLTISGVPTGGNKVIYATVRGDNYCENLTGKSITVTSSNTLTAPTFVAANLSVCGVNGTAEFMVDNFVTGLTYTIYDAATAGNVVATNVTVTGNTITFSNINASATYFVEVTGVGGCSAATRTQIQINHSTNSPLAALSDLLVNGSNGSEICADNTGAFVLSTTSTGITNPIYYLYQANVFVESNNTGTFSLAALTPGVPVTFSVGVSGDGNCETLAADRKSITFTPNELPATPTLNISGVKVITAGTEIKLIVTPIPAGAVSYQWKKDNVVLAETSTTVTIPNASAADLGTYTVVAVSAGGCFSTGSASVTLNFSDLLVWKSYSIASGATSVIGGEEVTYTIHVRNTAAVAKSGYTLTDAIPSNTALISIADGGTETAGVITWAGIAIPANADVTRSFTVKVNADLTGVTSINNVAYLDNGTDPQQPSSPPDPNDPNQPGGNPGDEGTTIPVRDVTSTVTWKAFSISGGAASVKGGEDVTYTIYVRNTGNQNIPSLVVRDDVPAQMTLASVADGGIVNGSSLVWSGTSLAVGQTATFNFTVKVNSDLTGVAAIKNIAVTNDGINPDQPSIPPSPTDPTQPGDPTQTGTDIPVTTVSDFVSLLTVTGSNANGLANAGDILTYTLAVTNTGNQKLTGIQISEPIPANTTYVGSSAGGSVVGNNIIFNTADLIPAQGTTVTVQVRVNNNLTGVTVISNTATINSNEATKTSNQADIQVNQGNAGFTADLTVSSSNPNGQANAGDILTYTLVVTNTGTQTLTGIQINEPVPANTTYIGASAGGNLVGSNIVFSPADLLPGESATVTAQVSVNNNLTGVTVISNTATVNANEASKTSNQADIQVNQGTAGFNAVLSVSSSNANGQANAADILTYTLVVSNTGTQTLTGIQITEPVPANTTYVGASAGGSLVGSNVVFSPSDLLPGQSATVTAQVKVNNNLTGVTVISNTATVNSNQASKTSNQADIQVNQGVAGFSAVLSVSSSNANGQANAADILTYTLVVSNTGTQLLTGIQITEPVPANTTYVGASAGGSLVGNNMVFNPSDLLPGQSVTVTTQVKVNNNLAGVTSITQTANVVTNQLTKQSNQVSLPVGQVADFTTNFTVASSNSNGKANAGDMLTYSLTITNTGNQNLTSIKITDPLPAHTDFGSAPGGGLVGNDIIFNVPDLTPGQSHTVMELVKVQSNLTGVSAIINVASIATAQVTKTAGPVSIDVNANVAFDAVLSVASSGSNGKANIGDILTYELKITNTGDQKLTQVRVIDAVPAGTDFVSASHNGGLSGEDMVINATDVDPGQAVTVTLKVKVRNDISGLTKITNTATVATALLTKQSNTVDILTVLAANQIYTPNAFTPNGDGKNDLFEIYGNTIKSVNMNVYNQWGQRIYQTNNLAKGWDGTYKGEPQPNGVYVYYIDVKFFDGTETLKKGTVTLLK